MAFSHLCPSYTAISIKCSPWGTNNNKQLLVNALYQHVPFALLPLLNSQPTNIHSATAAPNWTWHRDAFVCVSVCISDPAHHRVLNSWGNWANAHNSTGHYSKKLWTLYACQTHNCHDFIWLPSAFSYEIHSYHFKKKFIRLFCTFH